LHYQENLGNDQNKYYRLKQVDFNGSFDYSNVIFVNRKNVSITELIVYPNPVENQINIVYDNTDDVDYSLKIIAVDGSVVQSERSLNFVTGNLVSIETSDLAKGVYTLMFSDDYGLVLVRQFVKK